MKRGRGRPPKTLDGSMGMSTNPASVMGGSVMGGSAMGATATGALNAAGG